MLRSLAVCPVEPEFSKVLANIRRESNILSPVIMREAFDSGHLATMTVNPREAFGAHISISAHITPEELRRSGCRTSTSPTDSPTDSFGSTSSQTRSYRTPSRYPDEQLDEFVNRLKVTFHGANELTNKVGQVLKSSIDTRVKMDSEAAEVWRIEYDKLCCEWPGMIGVLMARGSCHVLRLALLYALLDPRRERGKKAKADSSNTTPSPAGCPSGVGVQRSIDTPSVQEGDWELSGGQALQVTCWRSDADHRLLQAPR